MKFFLKIKPWQLFIVLVVPMFVPSFFISPENISTIFGPFMLVIMGLAIGWMYSVGSTSNSRLPEDLAKNPTLYRAGYIVSFIYILLLWLFDIVTLENSEVPAWVIPMHMASVFGMFYGLYFTSKQFMTLRNGRRIKFIDYGGAFFLFWFFPFGLWFIQPRVNEVLSDEA